jgi:hypothetical protein
MMNALLFGCTAPEQESQRVDPRPQDLVMASAVDLYTIDPAVGFDKAIGNSLAACTTACFAMWATHLRSSPGWPSIIVYRRTPPSGPLPWRPKPDFMTTRL